MSDSIPGQKKSLDRWNDRTELLIGPEAVERLKESRVFIAGVGGVGGYAAEMLARAGIGHLTLIDADTVSVTNLNRQLIASIPTLGRNKTDLFSERFRSFNPDIEIKVITDFITVQNVEEFITPRYDYVIDSIDTVAPKVAMIAHCLRNKIPVISSMGAGGRLNPAKVGYFDLWDTREDGLARAVRQRLRKINMCRPLKVVASTEAPRHNAVIELNERNKRSSYGTLATIPAIFGIYLASYVINKLSGK